MGASTFGEFGVFKIGKMIVASFMPYEMMRRWDSDLRLWYGWGS